MKYKCVYIYIYIYIVFDDEVWMSASYGVELNLKNSFMDTQNELEA